MYNFLKKVPLFADLPEADLKRLGQIVEEVRLSTGEELFAEGSPGDRVYIVQEGQLEIFKAFSGREILLAVPEPGEVIGEMALLGEMPRVASVRARTDSVLLAIQKEQLDHLLSTSPSAALAMFYTILARWQATEQEVKVRTEALRESEKRYRALFEESRDAIFISSPEGKIVDVNQAALDLFGFTRDEAIGSDVTDRFVNQADWEGLRQAIIEGGGSVKDFGVILRRKDGTEMDCLLTTSRRRTQDGSWGEIQGNIRDITEQRQAEKALRESEERFRAVAQSANDAIISADSKGNIIFWNKGAQTIFGYEEEEVLGRPLIMLMPERYREAHQEGLERFKATGEPHIMGKTVEMHGLRKDGSEFPLELSLADWKTREGRFFSSILRDITKRKQAEKALRERENMLRQSEKMAQLGTLTAGVAHELNNPAAAVKRGAEQLGAAITQLGQAQSELSRLALLEAQRSVLHSLTRQAQEQGARPPPELNALARSDREVELETWLEERGVTNAWEFASTLVNLGYDLAGLAALAEHFTQHPDQLPAVISWLNATYTVHNMRTEIGQGATHISKIVKALKSYSYLDQAPVQAVDVHQGLDNTLLILRYEFKSGVSVRREYAPDLPKIHAYGSELNQVWTNIIDNAADALEGQGEIIIRTNQDEEWVVVEIEDSGPGIPAEIQSRVFDAFFTTKPPGQGTGLGLNISYNIVHKHRGDIKLFSQPGKTCFRVRLPVNFEAR
jgi:PAS domain S-box-containing protein